jgi:hypothetical protein
MNGMSLASEAAGDVVSTDWSLAGVGDFDGDAKADLVWRHDNGAMWVDLTDFSSGIGYFGAWVPTDWTIEAVRDFDGDLKSDILWRNTAGSTWLYLMDGVSASSEGAGNYVATDWQVVDP